MIELAVGKNKHILKERILKHATMLFYTNGVKMIKMDTIAKDLSISKKNTLFIFSYKRRFVFSLFGKRKRSLMQAYGTLQTNWKS